MQTVSLPGFPADIVPVIERFITCECATLTQHGSPITQPVTPYWGEDGRTIDVSTGLTYPAKAERARRNPKIALLFSDPTGSGLGSPPTVLVFGKAAVRDRNLQAGMDRYVRLSMQKAPAAYKGMPRFMLQRQAWYFARIWIEVTPEQILWWPDGDTSRTPQRWDAPSNTVYPPSDPAPAGKTPASWKSAPTDWRSGAELSVKALGLPILTVINEDGFPVPFRATRVTLEADGFTLEMPVGMPAAARGSACLTFHSHPEVFTGQQNMLFVGEASDTGSRVKFMVERQVGDFSLAGSKLAVMWTFLSSSFRLAPRLKAEATRRGQPVPTVHLP
jgi:hypothetical protein